MNSIPFSLWNTTLYPRSAVSHSLTLPCSLPFSATEHSLSGLPSVGCASLPLPWRGSDQESPVSQPTLSRPEEPFCPAWKVCCKHSSETNSISVSPFKEGARVIDVLCKGFQTLCWNPEWPLDFRSKCFHNLKRYCLYPKG